MSRIDKSPDYYITFGYKNDLSKVYFKYAYFLFVSIFHKVIEILDCVYLISDKNIQTIINDDLTDEYDKLVRVLVTIQSRKDLEVLRELDIKPFIQIDKNPADLREKWIALREIYHQFYENLYKPYESFNPHLHIYQLPLDVKDSFQKVDGLLRNHKQQSDSTRTTIYPFRWNSITGEIEYMGKSVRFSKKSKRYAIFSDMIENYNSYVSLMKLSSKVEVSKHEARTIIRQINIRLRSVYNDSIFINTDHKGMYILQTS